MRLLLRNELLGDIMTIALRTAALLGALTAATACTPLEMERPDAPPSAMEEAMLAGIGHNMDDGALSLAGATGFYTRDAGTEWAGMNSRHEGFARFTIRRGDIDGDLEGRCRSEAVDLSHGSVSMRARPLSYRCRFERDGERIDAHLELEEKPAWKDERQGYIFLGGRRIDIRSTHGSPQLAYGSGAPLGYTFSAEGQDIGGIDLTNEFKKVYLPRDYAYREAAIAASVALALFRDVDAEGFDGAFNPPDRE
ncbi:MAG TPA: hypothetical protein VI381_01300 [Allosphingosinicella sp.]